MLPGVYLPGENLPSSVGWHTSRTQGTSQNASSPTLGQLGQQDDSLPHMLHLIKFMVHDSHVKHEDEGYLQGTMAMNESSLTGKNPIIGEGHHFVVFAIPYHQSDKKPLRAIQANQELYCIKYPNPSARDEAGFLQEIFETVRQEISVLCHPRIEKHENIIKLLGLEVSEDYDDYTVPWPCLCMEYADFGTLDSFQFDQGKLDPDLSRRFLLDCGLGLQSLHNCNIIHGDVKSENILICKHLTRKFIAKLSDFGLSLINPDPKKNHFLLGSTWMWEAPEAHEALSVDGLKLTDVYSFGLVAWRVLLNRSIPYELLGFDLENRRDEFIKAVKVDEEFPNFVNQTIVSSGLPDPMKKIGQTVIYHTLSKEPSGRNFNVALTTLAGEFQTVLSENVAKDHDLKEASTAYWAPQSSGDILEKILEAYPDNFLYLRSRPSALYALIVELKHLSKRDGAIGLHAANLAFRLATSPELNYGEKNPDDICRLYIRLSQLGSLDHAASLPFYFRLVNRPLPSEFNIAWLEEAANNDYYMAEMALSTEFPSKYRDLLRKIEDNALSTFTELSSEMLLTHLRLGNYEQSKALLSAGVSPFSDEEDPSAMHWLVSFSDETQIRDLAHRIIASGGLLDTWWADETIDSLLSANISGTPLHWACVERNISFMRVLFEIDPNPEGSNIDKAVLIASALHFHDALEILQRHFMQPRFRSQPAQGSSLTAIWNGLVIAASSSHYHLPRILRHGANGTIEAMIKTVQALLVLYSPNENEQHQLICLASSAGNAKLLHYFFTRFEIPTRQSKWKDRMESYFIGSIMMGHYETFEMYLDNNLISPKQAFIGGKFTAIQGCCLVRQRNPAFMQKFLDLGCHPDQLGPSDPYALSPFGMAVSLGLYDCASLLLQRGADKNFKSGWMGGQTSFWRILQQPDVAISRIRFLLEALPQEGFGHVDFIAWPGARANILYQFATNPWAHYRTAYQSVEIIKYILSMMADKSCLNKLCGLGVTALGMAAQHGSLPLCRVLLKANIDPNAGLARTPLNAALEWLGKCHKREKRSWKTTETGEKKLATKLLKEAEETVNLLRAHGAVDELRPFNPYSAISSGEFKQAAPETLFEILAGFVSPPGTRGNLVNQGSLSLHPTNADEFRAHHGQSSAIQKLFGMSGRLLGTGTTAEYQLRPAAPPRLYQSHSCWPWILCGYHTGNPPQWNARQSIRDSLTNLTSSRTSSSETESSRFNSSIQSRPLLPGVVLPGHLQRSSQTRQSSAHSPPLYSQENVILGEYFGSSHYQTSGLETSARDASNLYAMGKETPSGTLDPLNQQLAAMAIEPSTSTSFSENSSGVGENQRHLEAVQAQLEESLQKYLRDHRPQQRDGQSQTINASQKRALAVILTTSLSAAEFRVPEHCSSIEQCEDFAMIASTIEGIVGDLALYGVALEPILVGGQLSIFVCSDDI